MDAKIIRSIVYPIACCVYWSCAPSPAPQGQAQAASTPSYTPSNGTYLGVNIADIVLESQMGMRPCLDNFSMRVSPIIDGAALQTYVGGHTGHDEDYGLAIEALFEVKTPLGAVLYSEQKSYPLLAADFTTSSTVGTRLFSFGWDGTYWSEDDLLITSTGTKTVELTIRLVRIETEGFDDTELDSGLISTSITVSAPSLACEAWRDAAASLGESDDHTLLVGGMDTKMRPWATWRHGRPNLVVGNFGHVTTTRLAALANAFDSYQDLFGVTDDDDIESFQVFQENEWDGTTILQVDQVNAQFGPRRLIGGRIAAYFDTDDRLVAISGDIAQGFADFVPIDLKTEAEVESFVEEDYETRTGKMGAVATVKELVVVETGMTFDPAMVVDVSFNSRQQVLPMRYIVSGRTYAIYEAKSAVRSSGQFEDVEVVTAEEPSDLVWLPGCGMASSTTCPLEGSDSLTTADRHIFVDGDGDNHLTLSDLNGPSPIIAWTGFHSPSDCFSENDVEGCIGVWKMTTAFDETSPFSIDPPLSIEFTSQNLLLARTAYYEIQNFWYSYGIHFAPCVDPLGLVVSSSLAVGLQRSFYANGTIHLAGDLATTGAARNRQFYTPTHESFHHYEHNVIDLEYGCNDTDQPCQVGDGGDCACRYLFSPNDTEFEIMDVDDDHRMPTHMIEGLATFTQLIVDPWPMQDNSAAVVIPVAYFCGLVWLNDSFEHKCVEASANIYRKQTALFDYPATMTTASSLFPQWPDCLTQMGDTNNCMVVRLPDDMSNVPAEFIWSSKHRPPQGEALYRLVSQTLQQTWEEIPRRLVFASLGEYSEVSAELFPKIFFRAVEGLESDSSFNDLLARVRLAALVTLSPNVESDADALAAVDAAIKSAFADHGIDPTLGSFCVDNDECH